MKTEVGYSGGNSENPTYESVCYQNTDHAEVLMVEFDDNELSYENLVDEDADAAAFLSSVTATATTATAATTTASPAIPSPANPAAAPAAAPPAAAPAPAPAPALPPAADELAPELALELLDCANAACALNNIMAHKIEIIFFIVFNPGGFNLN